MEPPSDNPTDDPMADGEIAEVLNQWPAPTNPRTRSAGVWQWWLYFITQATKAVHSNVEEIFERARVYLSLMATETAWTGDEGIVAGSFEDRSYADLIRRGTEPSRGLFMMNLNGAARAIAMELGRENVWTMLADPDFQFEHFAHRDVDDSFDRHWSDPNGPRGAQLAIEVGRDAERPLDRDGSGPEGPEAYGQSWDSLTKEAGW